MANLVITSTTDSIKVVFNDYASAAGYSKGTWNKRYVRDITLNGHLVTVDINGGQEWTVSYNSQNGALIVDTIDGAAPTSASDLYDKLVALIA